MLPILCLLGSVAPSASTQNLSVYRVTPKNYSGLVNMNSGE